MKQNKESTPMEDLNLESLKMLSGIKKTIEECGIPMGSPMGSHTPATINITASNGPELTGMLKDIMSLAGVQSAPTAGPAHAEIDIVKPSGSPDMKSLIDTVSEPDMEEDSMNTDFAHATTEPEEEIGPDGVSNFGDIDNNHQNALVGHNVRETYDNLMNEYRKFVSESQRAEFGSRLPEILAMAVYDLNPNLSTSGRADELVDAGWRMMAHEFGYGEKRANFYFNRDEDIISDMVDAYERLQNEKQSVAEARGKCTCTDKKSSHKSCAVHGKMDEGSTGDYSAKKARAGKDIGKPGKNFEKIAKGAAQRYGSEEKGKKVAGAVLAKLRNK